MGSFGFGASPTTESRTGWTSARWSPRLRSTATDPPPSRDRTRASVTSTAWTAFASTTSPTWTCGTPRATRLRGRRSPGSRGCRATTTSCWSRPTIQESGSTTGTPSRASTRVTRTTTRRSERLSPRGLSSSCAAAKTSTCTSGRRSTHSSRRLTPYTRDTDAISTHPTSSSRRSTTSRRWRCSRRMRCEGRGPATPPRRLRRRGRRLRSSCNRPRRRRRSSPGT